MTAFQTGYNGQLDWFIFIWFSLIVYCKLVLRELQYFIVYLVHTLTVWPYVYMFYVFVLPNMYLFDLGALLSPRLSVFCTFAYMNNFCWSVSFLFQFNRLLKNTLRYTIAYNFLFDIDYFGVFL